ncbi:MAG TPA: hypothetical protein VGO40_07130 [Longimicrobium sp.]|nr:hypothetical protein [Longimicrobium sp.]
MEVSRLWEPYGLRSSPFFQDELRPADSEHPTTLFIGREEELRRIETRVVSDPHTRTIVEGDPGVGKTSFVNRVKADAKDMEIATYEHPIRITQETTLTTFVADVLRTVVRIRSAAGMGNDQAFWKRTVRWLEGGEVRGGSLSAFGVGGGVTRTFIPPQVPGDALYEMLGEALQQVNKDLGGPVLLHVNNLENLTGERVRQTALLLRDLRDYLLLAGAHWVFVGATGIDDEIFRVYDQVGGIFPAADTLRPLTPPQVELLLARRYLHLCIKGRTTPVEPIVPRDAADLYALYQGDLRNFLRLLSDASERILGLRSVAPMTQAEVLLHASGEYQRHFRARLSQNDFDHVARLVAGYGGGDPEFRVTDAARLLKMAQPSASELVQRLVDRRIIRQTRTSGRSVYYRPTGAVLVGMGVSPAALSAGNES